MFFIFLSILYNYYNEKDLSCQVFFSFIYGFSPFGESFQNNETVFVGAQKGSGLNI